MSEQEVKDIMMSSKSESDWNSNCDKVIKACGGYPTFWYRVVEIERLFYKVSQSWNTDSGLKITTA